ncbi:hypothetical protein MNBD_GAMMA12-3875 [hydrothermal vent metagenome]|uniref:Uncharacterized protein n=1 Tax=hydrothermal vent metagenome TaxID=652676 RepID=A0A3B0YUL2_9ZZZZ
MSAPPILGRLTPVAGNNATTDDKMHVSTLVVDTNLKRDILGMVLKIENNIGLKVFCSPFVDSFKLTLITMLNNA